MSAPSDSSAMGLRPLITRVEARIEEHVKQDAADHAVLKEMLTETDKRWHELFVGFRGEWQRIASALIHDRDRHDKDIKEIRADVGQLSGSMLAMSSGLVTTKTELQAGLRGVQERFDNLLTRLELIIRLNGSGG